MTEKTLSEQKLFLSYHVPGPMLLKDETQHVYETIKFWKIIPQIYRHIYTHLTTNEKPFQSQRPCRKKKRPSLPSSFYFSSQTDGLFMLLNHAQWGEWQNATNSHGREHTNADMNPKITSLDGLSWSHSVDLNNEKLKSKPNKFPQIFKGSWKTWLAGIWRCYSAHITDQREDHISLTKSH